MYDELVKDLREKAGAFDYDGRPDIACDYEQAADAIEELSAFREHITDGHLYFMRDGVLYEAKVELPKGKVFQLPPMVFVEEGET